MPPEEKLSMVKNFLDCRLDAYEDYLLSRTARETVFRKPRKNKQLSKKGVVTKKMLDSGLMKSVIKACKETNLRMMKTIRLEMLQLVSTIVYKKTGCLSWVNFLKRCQDASSQHLGPALLVFTIPVQGFTNRRAPGCVNAAGMLRQKW